MSPLDGTQDPNAPVVAAHLMKENQINYILEPVVNDHVPTGSREILESPHVTDGPGKIANAPVPSVFVRHDKFLHSGRPLQAKGIPSIGCNHGS